MLHQLFDMPRTEHFLLACSGGVDSMAVADFYRRGGKNFTLAYFDHGTPRADAMSLHVRRYAERHGIPFITGQILLEKPKGQSPEEFWRLERYRWLTSHQEKVITCHHLNDAMETWLFSSLHGTSKIISPINGLVRRPFLLNTKQSLVEWCVRHDVEWMEDTSNADVKTPRNRIRHNILPECLKINPGLAKVIKRKIIAVVK